MQKIQFIVVSFLLTLSVQAQKNFPSPADNPVWTEIHEMIWVCSTQGTNGGCSGYYCECTTPVYYKSDTIINGMKYNRLYSKGLCNGIYAGGAPPDGCPFYYNYQNPESVLATIRQDTANNIVYILENNAEIILYDFNAISVGNAYPETYNTLQQYDTLIVISEDSIQMDSKYFKKWELGILHNGTIEDSGFVSIIEGIGSTFGVIAPLILPFENLDELLCFSVNGNVQFPDSSSDCEIISDVPELPSKLVFSIYPSLAENNLTIETVMPPDNRSFIRIVSSTGLKIIEVPIRNKITKIDVSTFKSGLYLVQCFNEETFETVKFIKK